MKYPIAIEPGNKMQAFSVIVPDLPGCFFAADGGIDQAIDHAKEAIELWIETALEQGERVPSPSPISHLQKNPDFKGCVWAIVEIDPALLSNAIERVNITLPKRILAKLDKVARMQGKTRSGLIAELALKA